MLRIIVRIRDKDKTNQLKKKYGTLIFVSPILNIIGMEIKPENLESLECDENVLSAEPEITGRLQYN